MDITGRVDSKKPIKEVSLVGVKINVLSWNDHRDIVGMPCSYSTCTTHYCIHNIFINVERYIGRADKSM